MPRAELPSIQRWFQDAVVRPSLPEGRIASAIENADAHIRPSKTLTPAERVEIYADMHIARLVGVLAEDYAAVRVIAGHDEFESIARGYLADHPSHSFTLSVLGRDLPEWIARNEDISRRALLADIARLELAMTRVFDAPREVVLTPAYMATLPADTWNDPKPRLIRALELLEFDHRANAIVRAVRQDAEMPALEPAPTRVVVWRKDDVVWRAELGLAAYAILSALSQRASLAEAVAAGEAAHDGDAAGLAERLGAWMSEWSADGLFSAIE